MTEERPIEEIGLDAQGHLFIRPAGASSEEFSYIYRDASGIRWNTTLRTLQAYEPERWEATALYRQMIAAVRREYGVLLVIKPSTRWSGVSDELRAAIQALPPESRLSRSAG
jgi:hypothetical protein